MQIVTSKTTFPSLSCLLCLIHYRGQRPVLIPLIRVIVRLRGPHPRAYGLLSRNSSTHKHTHTHTHRHRGLSLSASYIEEWGRFCLFRSSVRHWIPIEPASLLSGCSRFECVKRSYLDIVSVWVLSPRRARGPQVSILGVPPRPGLGGSPRPTRLLKAVRQRGGGVRDPACSSGPVPGRRTTRGWCSSPGPPPRCRLCRH